MVEDEKWREINSVLEADIDGLDNEADKLYNDIERYVRRADVLEGHGDEDTAEYFKELAVESYDAFVGVVQMKKDADDYDF